MKNLMVNLRKTLNLVIPFILFSSAVSANVDKETECLAMNVYHESRGESDKGKIAVAYTTLNRVEHNYFPDTFCEVVWQPSQFSWTNDGHSDDIKNQEVWLEILQLVELVINKKINDPTEGALFFHNKDINPPGWADSMELSLDEGNHLFYVWDGKW